MRYTDADEKVLKAATIAILLVVFLAGLLIGVLL